MASWIRSPDGLDTGDRRLAATGPRRRVTETVLGGVEPQDDHRVTHLWDGKDVTGTWFATQEAGYQGGDWEAYLFGPDATWTDQPTPLLSSGSTVAGSADRLLGAITPLLR